MRTLVTAVALCASLTLAACGNGDDPSAQPADEESQKMVVVGAESVPSTDIADVARAQETIQITCGVGQPGQVPVVDLPTAVRTIVRVTEENPTGRFAEGDSTVMRNMKTVATDNAKTLRGCGKTTEAAELEKAAKAKAS
jgi:hypothetical protein